MPAKNLTTLSALELARGLETGSLRAGDVVEAYLSRIAARDDTIRAWTCVSGAAARADAVRLDQAGPSGPMHGLPIGIKDVIDTAGILTSYGSPIYNDHVPEIDAAAVAQIRAGGGIVMGKTVTAEFAHRHPGPTVNPHDPARTPGGSSSGSAAAVADSMVPLALGTQTTASTIRPASYCGVVGYRPTYGFVSMAGVKPCAQSLDTIGLFARSVTDCALLRDCLLERSFTHPSIDLSRSPLIGFCRTPYWSQVAEPAARRVEEAVSRLAAAGAVLKDRSLPASFDDLATHHRAVSTFELSRNLAAERHGSFDQLSKILREGKLRQGLAMDIAEYAASAEALHRCRVSFADWMEDDVLIAPSAGDIAPLGGESTGPSEFSALWTALHLPVLSVPLPCDADRLPLGLQVIGRRGRDLTLFDIAAWISSVLV